MDRLSQVSPKTGSGAHSTLYERLAGPTSLPAGRLEQWLGKPASEWTVDHLIGLVEERGIRLVSLMHVGGDGWLKTLDFVPQSRDHLRAILLSGERADGSSLFPGTGIVAGQSDIVLQPRIASAFVDPFSPVPTLALLCGHTGRDHVPLAESPDTILHRAFDRAREEVGVELWAHGEVEYFIGRGRTYGDRYGTDDHGYHATGPVAFAESCRRRALVLLAEMGVPVKYAHAEVGYATDAETNEVWEQHEIELALTPLPRAAECVALTHWVLRNLVHAEGLDCSFHPIIGRGHAGNGLHFHFCPNVGGQLIPRRDAAGQFHPPTKWLIAGLTQMGTALMAFGNREEDSFVRLLQGKEAPTGVFWGEADRRALIRLPTVVEGPDGGSVTAQTVEFRLPDGSAYSYLVLAGVAQALVFGKNLPQLDALLETTASTCQEARGVTVGRVPRNFAEVARDLRKRLGELVAGNVFPEQLLDNLLEDLESRDPPTMVR